MKKKLTMINNIVCAVLLVVTFATMLIPCWDFIAEEKIKVKTCRECGLAVELAEGEEDLPDDYACPGQNGAACGATGKKSFKSSTNKITYPDSASVMEFTWMAYNNKGLTAEFEKQGYAINTIVLAPFLLTICVIAGVIACLLNKYGTWQSLFPLIGGGMMTYSFLTIKVFQVGPWIPALVSCIALTVAGLILFIQLATKIFKWFTVPCYKK